MSRKYIAAACLIISIVFITVTSCTAPTPQPPPAEKTLKIGSMMPLTGSAALWGQSIKPGMELYAQLVNEDGGIKVGNDTYKIELTILDAYGPATAAAAARKLIYDSNVTAVVGYFGLGIAAIAQVTNPEKVIMNIGTVGGRDPFPPEKSYVFYGNPQSEISLNQAIATMQAFPQYHTLAWTGSESGKHDIDAAFAPTDERLLKDFGIKSIRVYYPDGTMNFTPYLTKMAEQGVEVIYAVSTPLEVGLMAKQRYQMGYSWPIGQQAPSLDLNIMKGICGSEEAMQNLVSDYPVPWELKKVSVAPKYVDMSKRIWARYKEMYNKEMFTGGFSFANFMAQYFEALYKAGTTDPDAVMRAIRGGTFDTFMGRYKLSGTKYYGSDVVFGHPCSMCIVKGMQTVYLGEYTLTTVDEPFVEF
ncbi:MAG: ABC transporter substrate-binding protein [Chloroflexi bacterium]|nr:ABC transporter substrate-binding protein [Chloroflexota bacterium]